MPAVAEAVQPPIVKPPEHNRTGVDYRLRMPRPPVKGRVIDGHVHLLARQHADVFFEAADFFGLDHFISQSPLEEAIAMQREFNHRLTFVAVPFWQKLHEPGAEADWLRRIEAFHTLGARMAKIHLAPATMKRTGFSFEHPTIRRVLREIVDRGMIVMTHVGDPHAWYSCRYATVEKPDDEICASRDRQYRMWETAMDEYRAVPWLGAHLGGWPENPTYLQSLLERFPNLYLDLSATRWMVRELSQRRDESRDFLIRHADRIIWGSDQVTGDNRDWDFLASRWWAHRKLFETAYNHTTPILDPDLDDDHQPILRGLALPDRTLQKIYRDSALTLMNRAGVVIE